MDESTLLKILKNTPVNIPETLHNNVIRRIRSYKRERIIRGLSVVVLVLLVSLGLFVRNPSRGDVSQLKRYETAWSGDLRMNDVPWGNERVDLIYMGGQNDN